MASRSEIAVLGSVLLDNSKWHSLSALTPSDFLLSAHRKIFERMCALQALEVPIDVITLIEQLERNGELEAIGGCAFVSSLLDGVIEGSDLAYHVQQIIRDSALREVARLTTLFTERAQQGRGVVAEVRQRLTDAIQVLDECENRTTEIHRFHDIPDILEIESRPAEWLVPGMLPRQSLTLWSGADGTAKTFLALSLAISVASGAEFLGRKCQRCPVLYLDYENPAHEIQSRFQRITRQHLQELRIWGTWLPTQPRPIGHPTLSEISKAVKPLIILDPFRYAHDAEENDSTEMMNIMRHLRSYVTNGATVVVLHHTGKAEGSSGRGSSAIRGAVDVSYLQELVEPELLKIACVKNRFGPKQAILVQADFRKGCFTIADPTFFSKGRDYVSEIQRSIAQSPGMSQNDLILAVRIGRNKCIALLKKHDGRLWRSELGAKNSLRYFLLPTSTEVSVPHDTAGTAVPLYPPFKGGTAVQAD